MIDYIYSISGVKLFFLINSIVVGFSILSTLAIRKIIPAKKLLDGTDGFSRVDIVLSQIYAVLVGFVIYGLFNNFHDAEFTTYHEANTLENITIYSKSLPPPLYDAMKKEVAQYARVIINNDWDAMSHGKPINKNSELIIQKMKLTLYQYQTSSDIEKKMINSILDELKKLEDDRDNRIHLSTNSLPNEFFAIIIFLSSFLIISSFINGNWLFFHLSSSFFVSFAIASTLFLLLALDRPFRGELSIKPVAFQKVLENLPSQ